MLSDELFERCLRALCHAPADKPSLALLLDMHGDTGGLRAALELAFEAGRESAYDGGKVEWAARCTNPGCGHRDDEAPFWPRRDRESVEMYISRQISGQYELVRQVTSPWVRVPEAGDGDA
jgi:hypothetical protein